MTYVFAVQLVLIGGVAASWWPMPWCQQNHTTTVTIRSTVTSNPTCNCPLESIVTKSVSETSPICFCPREMILTTTTTARCYCPRESIVTTLESGVYHCPLESISTISTANPTCNCPLETIVPTTIIRYRQCNITSHSTPTAGSMTGTTSPSPTCSLSRLPGVFFLRATSETYILVDEASNRTQNVRSFANATAFHIRITNGIDGIEQLAFNSRSHNSSSATRYGARIQTSGITYGSPVNFFKVNDPPQQGSGYGIVMATFSTYLCQMSLITWMDHDLSYPLDCHGELWLGGGFTSGNCSSIRVTVSTGLP